MDSRPSLMQYLLSLTPKQAEEAVKALPRREQEMLVGPICQAVDRMALAVLQSPTPPAQEQTP
jgi:hypothetical protein